MKKWSIPQEGLKVIACVSMLLDHIGAHLVPWVGFRIVGRLAFPLFCFLLVQGISHTRSLRRYGLRLLLVAVFSEWPYDLLKFGRVCMEGQNAVLALFLGFGMTALMNRTASLWKKVVIIGAFTVAAVLLRVEYGGYGMILIAVFALSEGVRNPYFLHFLALVLMGILMPWTDGIPLQLFGILAMIPLSLYSGRKSLTGSFEKWGFYGFYPAHMAIIYFLLICGAG